MQIKKLGLKDYSEVWTAMRTFTNERDEQTDDAIWLVQHPPVFTQGQAGKAEHIFNSGDIPIVQTDRGGQVTYHGPGQVVIYPLLRLKRYGLGVRDLVTLIEQSVLALLKEDGVMAEVKPNAPGVYVNGEKIASLGLRIRKGCSYHGVSLNVDMDLAPFQRINPCGYNGLKMTQLVDVLRAQAAGTPPTADQVEQGLLRHIQNRLAYRSNA